MGGIAKKKRRNRVVYIIIKKWGNDRIMNGNAG